MGAGAGERADSLGCGHGQRRSQAGPPHWLRGVKLDVCLVPTAPQQCIIVGPVFRQSDRSQPEHPENLGNQRSTHTSPSQHLHPPSTCLVCEATLVCVSSSFPAWNLFPDVFLLFHLPPSFSLSPPSTLCSLILSCLSLCLSLPLLLRFNKSPGGRREKTGGCKNIYGFIYKGPRYCPVLNPGEMIYFPSMCGTDPRGVTQQWTGFVLAIYGGCRGS